MFGDDLSDDLSGGLSEETLREAVAELESNARAVRVHGDRGGGCDDPLLAVPDPWAGSRAAAGSVAH